MTSNIELGKSKLENFFQDFNSIKGWFHRPIVDLMLLIDYCQQQNNIKGSVAEIGVYHGKSFIPLLSLCKDNELALAVDCFEDRQFNRDGSGLGAQYDSFMQNCEKYVPWNSNRVKVMKGDSLSFTAQSYSNQINTDKVRIFSIDGGHTAEATYDDMKKADQLLQDGGCIIVDDFFNHGWPGVGEGVYKFILQDKPDLHPFLIGWNKVMFTNSRYVEKYISTITSHIEPQKYAEFLGSTTCIF